MRPSRGWRRLVALGLGAGAQALGGRIGGGRRPAKASELAAAREYARGGGGAFGLDDDRCYEFAFAVNEAVTNAIRHGRPDEHGDIHLSVFADDDRLTFSVRDCGTFAAS